MRTVTELMISPTITLAHVGNLPVSYDFRHKEVGSYGGEQISGRDVETSKYTVTSGGCPHK